MEILIAYCLAALFAQEREGALTTWSKFEVSNLAWIRSEIAEQKLTWITN